MISDVKHTDADPELQAKVSQVMELTGKSSDEVIVALHDCDHDVTKAVNMLHEGAQDQVCIISIFLLIWLMPKSD